MISRLSLLIALSFVIVGCAKGDRLGDVDLPETPVLSVRESWGVVRQPYVRVYDSPESESRIVGHVRSGVVAEITARVVLPVGDGTEGWVQVQQEGLVGWVDRREIELYETRERAVNAARAIAGG